MNQMHVTSSMNDMCICMTNENDNDVWQILKMRILLSTIS